jgi:SnoaL-like polyketide cyclase
LIFINHTLHLVTAISSTDYPQLFPLLHIVRVKHGRFWQLADGDRVTTYKTYYGTHEGTFLGVAPTHRKIHFEAVDVMRVQNGKITDHWGVGNLLSLMEQIGGWTPSPSAEILR